jgi:hypothetical protein
MRSTRRQRRNRLSRSKPVRSPRSKGKGHVVSKVVAVDHEWEAARKQLADIIARTICVSEVVPRNLCLIRSPDRALKREECFV